MSSEAVPSLRTLFFARFRRLVSQKTCKFESIFVYLRKRLTKI